MRKYKKGDDEYLGNGWYIIDDEEYKSISTFKDDNGIPTNHRTENSSDGTKLKELNMLSYPSVPDEGDDEFVYLYKVEELELFYKIFK